MTSRYSTSFSSSSSPTMRLAALLAVAASLVAAQSSVYVPGPVDENPGAALVNIGAGVDGYTTYVIEGVTLQENAQSAVMTQYGTDGLPVVYNCALGPDAQATCSVMQGNGVGYQYIEPITYFGESTGQLPAAFMTTSTPVAESTSAGGVSASSSTPAAAAASSTATSASSQAASANKAGPAAGQAQQTGANVFGAVDTSGSSSSLHASSIGKMILGSLAAAIAGGAMLFA